MIALMEPRIENKVQAINLRVRFLILGACLIGLGLAAITATAASTIIMVLLLGTFLVAAGIAHVVHAVQARQFGRLALELLLAAIYVIGGVALMCNPFLGALSATIVMAAFLACIGVLKIVYALTMRQFLFRYWVWLMLAGVLDTVLSGLIWAGWPSTAQWVLGLFAGIQMIFHGASLLALAAACNHLKMYVFER